MTETGAIIMIRETIVLGAKAIGSRIGHHPNDIPYLVRHKGLKAWRSTGRKSIWKAIPADLDEFNRRMRDEWLEINNRNLDQEEYDEHQD